jgi:hypothetical protein
VFELESRRRQLPHSKELIVAGRALAHAPESGHRFSGKIMRQMTAALAFARCRASSDSMIDLESYHRVRPAAPVSAGPSLP